MKPSTITQSFKKLIKSFKSNPAQINQSGQSGQSNQSDIIIKQEPVLGSEVANNYLGDNPLAPKLDSINIQNAPETSETAQLSDSHKTQKSYSKPIITLFVLGEGEKVYQGDILSSVLKQAGFKYSPEAEVFDMLSNHNQILFSCASALNPGIFPREGDLSLMHTPGLVFFMDPNSLEDPLSVFDAMLSKAQKIAGSLNAQLLDHTRDYLTESRISEYQNYLEDQPAHV